MATQEGWARRVTLAVAEEVKRHRKRHRVSTQQLADRCAELGAPIPRSVLANLEGGRRDSVSVAEVLVLAKALDIPAALLVFPLGQTNEMEILPGMTMTPWEALEWTLGRPAEGEDENALPGAATLRRFERYHQTVRGWTNLRERLREVDAGIPDDYLLDREQLLDSLARFERDIKHYREGMRRDDLLPPPLPAALAGLDEGPYPTRGLPRREVES